jgi:hypothetical protein
MHYTRQQCLDGFEGFRLGQLSEHVAQVGIGFQSVGLGDLDERVEIGAGLGTVDPVAEQPVLVLMECFA